MTAATLRFALTHPQQRVMNVEAFYPGTSMFNIGGYIKISGLLDAELLASAIREFVARHAQLRMRLVRDGALLCQEIAGDGEPVEILRHALDDTAVEHLIAERFQSPFRLMDAPLHRFAVHLSRTSTYFEIKVHHVAADGWSMNLLTRQVFEAYERLRGGTGAPPPPPPVYLDLLASERAYLGSDVRAADERFWTEHLSGLEPARLGGSPGTAAARSEHSLDPARSTRLRAFCRAHGLAPEVVFAAGFGALLARRHRLERLALGLPRLNRRSRQHLATFGMFTNVMPIVVRAPRGDVATLLREVAAELRACAAHQKLPYDLVVRCAGGHATGPRQLYDVSFNFYAGTHRFAVDGLPATTVELFSGHLPFRLALGIREWSEDGSFAAFIDHRTADYDATAVAELWRDLVRLLDAALADPGLEVARLLESWVDPRAGIHRGPTTELPEATVSELFERQAAAHPDRVALRHGDAVLRYGELDARAAALAERLRQLGVRPAEPVGVIGAHSFEIVVAFVALAKLGAVCVPMDHHAPAERVRSIAAESGMRHVLHADTAGGVPVLPGLAAIDLREPGSYASAALKGSARAAAHDPVYMIFTSGSTGTPKGVLVSQRSLLNYLWWGRSYYLAEQTESFALYSSLAFDLTLTSIYLPLVTGQEIVVYEARPGELTLDRILREDRCSIIKLTPSHLALIGGRSRAPARLRLLIVGGERFDRELAERVHAAFAGRVVQINEYGPTEATIGCMHHRFDPATDAGAGSVPIGAPIDNATIMLLDEALAPVPRGEQGEIYIGGECVALAYHRQPAWTAERFLPDPHTPGGRMYRTGDLAIVNRRGQLEYVGRRDRQCKFLGFRIEPEEIEAALAGVPGIDRAHVTLETDVGGTAQLVAHVAARPGAFDERRVRGRLRERLPHYMVPTHFIALDELPLTLNGKVDGERLPRLATSARGAAAGPADVGAAVIAALRAVLGVESIGADANFFALGGDSVKAIQIASHLEHRGVVLGVRDILSFPEVGRMQELATRRDDSLADDDVEELPPLPMTPIIGWFRDQHLPAPGALAQAAVLELEAARPLDEVAGLIDELVASVPIFRGALAVADGSVTPRATIARAARVERIDAAGTPEDATIRRLEALARARCGDLDPAAGDLVRGALARVAPHRYLLLLVIHHIAIDIVSWHHLVAELDRAVRDRAVDSARARRHYRRHVRWAAGLRELAGSLAPAAGYWSEALAADGPLAPRPGAPPRLADCTRSSATLSAALTEQLLSSANRAFTTRPLELVVAAVARALAMTRETRALVLELEGHGRDAIVPGCDVSRCIGWFTALYPVALAVTGRLDRDVPATKDRVRIAAARAAEPGVLQHIGRVELPRGRRCRLNFLGELDAAAGTGPVRLRSMIDLDGAAPDNPLTCLLDIVALVRAEQLHVIVKGCEAELGAGFVGRLAAAIQQALGEVVAFCASRSDVEPTRSDFDAVDLTEAELANLVS